MQGFGRMASRDPVAVALGGLLKQTNDVRTEAVERGLAHCVDAARDVHEHGADEAQLRELQDAVLLLARLDQRMELQHAILTELTKSAAAYPNGQGMGAIMQQRLDSLVDNAAEHPQYRDLLQRLNLAGGGDDDVLVEGCPALPRVCPITQRAFENPVRSRRCNHVYSEKAIQELLRRGRGGEVRCPVPACPHKVSSRDLVADPSVVRELNRRRRAEALAHASQSATDTQHQDDVVL